MRHRIDETSPLYGWTREQLQRADMSLFASVCIDTVIVAPEFFPASGAPNSWTNRSIATYSHQEALEEDGVTESLPNI